MRRFVMATALGAAAGLLVAGPIVRADEPASAPESAATTETESLEPLPLGMDAVQALGLKPTFDDLHLTFNGWIEQSYTFNTRSPSSRSNASLLNDRSNAYQLNQVTLNLERSLSDGKGFDWGGRIEGMAGTDARFLHQNGLADRQDNMVQVDPEQFYLDARLPIGNGLIVKVGRYATPVGYESFDAPSNALFSHSLIWAIEPITNTGVQFNYALTNDVGVYYGLVIGYDDFRDRNSSVTHMFGGSWAINDQTNLALNVAVGPEQVNNNHTYRTLVDVIATYKPSNLSPWSFALNGDFRNENGTGGVTATTPGANNNVYGLAAYATYTYSPQLAATVRGEYFRDGTSVAGEIWGLTAGLDIHPCKNFMNLRVRPEVKWYHHTGSNNIFDVDGSGVTAHSKDQVLLAVDVIVTF